MKTKLKSKKKNMIITVNNKTPIVVPEFVRRKAGLKSGDQVEFKVSGGIINIIPKASAVDDGYTPAQRRMIDARLAEAQQGPYHGPFDTAATAIKFLHSEIKRRKATKSR
jgi:AbrB family looped-hinge helix DNA binding protein